MKRKRYSVPVERAIVLYQRFGTWTKVRAVLRRPDGSTFTISGLFNAVRRYDRRTA